MSWKDTIQKDVWQGPEHEAKIIRLYQGTIDLMNEVLRDYQRLFAAMDNDSLDANAIWAEMYGGVADLEGSFDTIKEIHKKITKLLGEA